MDNDRLIAYQQAIQLKMYEGELVWSRSQTMLVANTVLIAAVGIFLGGQTPNYIASATLSFLGLILLYVWLVTSVRGFAFNTFWALSARELEENSEIIKLLTRGENFKNNKIVEFDFIDPKTGLRKRHQRSWVGRRFSTEKGVYVLISLFFLFYLGLLVLSLSNILL